MLLKMADEPSQRERALRRLPLQYSLALRMRGVAVSADATRQHVNVEQSALERIYCTADAKLPAAQNATDDRYRGCQ